MWMSMRGLHQFRKTRARITRLRDSLLLNGWTIDVTPGQLVISIDNASALAPEDELLVELFGHKFNLIVNVSFQVSLGKDCVLDIISEPRITPGSESVRIAAHNVQVALTVDGEGIIAKVTDMAVEGAGMILPVDLPRGASYGMTFETPSGDVVASGEIRYCREITPGTFQYRCGVLLTFSDRVSKARWQTMFAHTMAA